MGKSKKKDVAAEAEKEVAEIEQDTEEQPTLTYEDLVERALPIAQPMASRKLAKKAFKVAKKCASKKKAIIGLKAVAKALRKGEKGYVLLAGDTDPMDVITHFPVLCEENSVPYIWVPSRKALGQAFGKGSMITALVQSGQEYEELFNDVHQKIKETPHPM